MESLWFLRSPGLLPDVTFFHSNYMYCIYWLESAAVYVHPQHKRSTFLMYKPTHDSWHSTCSRNRSYPSASRLRVVKNAAYTHGSTQPAGLGKHSLKQISAGGMRISSTVGVNNVNYVGNKQFESSVVLRLNLPCSKNKLVARSSFPVSNGFDSHNNQCVCRSLFKCPGAKHSTAIC